MVIKTYLPAPNFDVPPDSSIRLGALLVNPFTPHRALASLATNKWPKITVTTQDDRIIEDNKQHGASFATGGQLLQSIGVKLRGEHKNNEHTKYSMKALRTEFFQEDPSEGDIKALLNTPKVQNAMQSTFWSRPLFLITGIKIAQGFSFSSNVDVQHNGNIGADIPVPGFEGIAASFDVAGSLGDSHGDSFKAGNEVVLAYRLLKISRKGWKERRLAFEEYRSKSAFLGADEDNENWGDEIECTEAVDADFSELGDEYS